MKVIRVTREMFQTGKESFEVLKMMDLSRSEIKWPDFDPVERYPQEPKHIKAKMGLFKSCVISYRTFGTLLTSLPFLEKYDEGRLEGHRKTELIRDILGALVELLAKGRTLELGTWGDAMLIKPSGLPPIVPPAEFAVPAFLFFSGDLAQEITEALMNHESVEIVLMH